MSTVSSNILFQDPCIPALIINFSAIDSYRSNDSSPNVNKLIKYNNFSIQFLTVNTAGALNDLFINSYIDHMFSKVGSDIFHMLLSYFIIIQIIKVLFKSKR